MKLDVTVLKHYLDRPPAAWYFVYEQTKIYRNYRGARHETTSRIGRPNLQISGKTTFVRPIDVGSEPFTLFFNLDLRFAPCTTRVLEVHLYYVTRGHFFFESRTTQN